MALSANSIAKYLSNSGRTASGSNYLTMCEVAVKVSHASVQCRACEGYGYRELSTDELTLRANKIARETDTNHLAQLREQLNRESTCRVCRGVGYITQKRADRAAAMDSMFTTVRCGRCKGCGETLYPNDASAEVGDVCLACGGECSFVPVTVKESGSSKKGKAPSREPSDGDDDDAGVAVSSWLDEDAAVEQGRVGREFEALREQDPEVAAAIESYYGLDGDIWGKHKWGRIFSLWQHTAAGKRLAQESAERSHLGHGFLIKPLELIASERDAELRAAEKTSRRRALIARADSEARQLFQRMQSCLGSEAA